MKSPAEIAGAALLALLACLGVSCATPPPPPSGGLVADDRATQPMAVARRAYEGGDFAQAQALYRQALMRARAIDDAALAADAAYNLAVSEIALQNFDAADQRLREAAYDAARASTDVMEIALLRAKVAYLRGKMPEAIELASALIASGAAATLRIQATILRGQIHADSGNLAAAKADLASIESRSTDPANALSPAVAADRTKLEGSIALSEGSVNVAAKLFDAEAQRLREARRFRDMARALARSADAYASGANLAAAAERYFLAARSLDGLGDVTGAKGYLASSIAAADRAGDQDTLARARALLDEINRRAAP